MVWSGEHRAFIVEEFIKNGGSLVATQRRRFHQIWPPAIFFSRATSKQRFTNNVPKLWKLWRRRYDRKLLPLHLKWLWRSWTTTERGYISVSIFKAATWVMFCSKHVDVKRHSVYFPEIKKTFAISSLVLNLLASQIGDFFLPHPVHFKVCNYKHLEFKSVQVWKLCLYIPYHCNWNTCCLIILLHSPHEQVSSIIYSALNVLNKITKLYLHIHLCANMCKHTPPILTTSNMSPVMKK